jgi:hypothetical protein
MAGKARAAGMLDIERKFAATAALNQPGGELAALWQSQESLASRRFSLSLWSCADSALNHAEPNLCRGL